MEKLFQVNKWFVAFCGALILIFAALQVVATMHLGDIARICGRDVFTWAWPGMNLHSSAQITDAHVLERSETNAKVKIKGEQTIGPEDDQKPFSFKPEKTECEAVLTFYKASNNWILGRVELK